MKEWCLTGAANPQHPDHQPSSHLTELLSPILKGSRGAYSIDSGPSSFSNNFSETVGPISIKFHIQHPGRGRLKICSNDQCFMAKMATMLIHVYGNCLKNSSSPELLGWLPWNLVCSIRWLSTGCPIISDTICRRMIYFNKNNEQSA